MHNKFFDKSFLSELDFLLLNGTKSTINNINNGGNTLLTEIINDFIKKIKPGEYNDFNIIVIL